MELPSLRKAAEALQSARFIKRQYFTLRWTTGILDFPPFASQIIRPPSYLLQAWTRFWGRGRCTAAPSRKEGAELQQRHSSQRQLLPNARPAPSKHQGLQQEIQALITRQPLCCGTIIGGPWNRTLFTLANARKGSAELTHLIIPLRRE